MHLGSHRVLSLLPNRCDRLTSTRGRDFYDILGGITPAIGKTTCFVVISPAYFDRFTMTLVPTDPPQSFGFLLIPGFSLMAFTATIEPLRAANQLSGKDLYTWKVYSPDGSNVASKHNIEIVPDTGIDKPANVEYLFVRRGILAMLAPI